MQASATHRRIRIDGHVHVYPQFDWQKAIQALLRNLASLPHPATADATPCLGLLAESRACHFFADVHDKARVEGSNELQLEAMADHASLRIQSHGETRGYLVAGRQIVTRERLELLALGADVATPDALSIEATLDQVCRAGAIPVLSWSPGKWFGHRGDIVKGLIEREPPGRFLIGDTSLRPRCWPLPCLMRNAQDKGFKCIAGSDALPFPGEEAWIGTYGTETEMLWDDAAPAASLVRHLAAPTARFTPIGHRSGTAAFVTRWVRNQRSRKAAPLPITAD